MKKRVIYTAAFLLLIVPAATGAQTLINQIIANVTNTLNVVIGVLLVVASVVFLWGVTLFIASTGDPAKREKAKGTMLWGIIGLAVLTVAWGVANILFLYFGIPSESPKQILPPVFKNMFP